MKVVVNVFFQGKGFYRCELINATLFIVVLNFRLIDSIVPMVDDVGGVWGK